MVRKRLVEQISYLRNLFLNFYTDIPYAYGIYKSVILKRQQVNGEQRIKIFIKLEAQHFY